MGVGFIPVSFRMTDPNKDLGDRLISRWVIYRRVTKPGGTKCIINSCVWKHGWVDHLVNSLKIVFFTLSLCYKLHHITMSVVSFVYWLINAVLGWMVCWCTTMSLMSSLYLDQILISSVASHVQLQMMRRTQLHWAQSPHSLICMFTKMKHKLNITIKLWYTGKIIN